MLDYFNSRLDELLDITDRKELEKGLEQQLIQLYDNTDHEALKSNKGLKNANNKYRAASAMQKMVRRGRADVARDMAHGLLTLDPDYVWRRLCTVALEDIGVANIGLVAAYLWLAGKKQWRVQRGGDQRWLMMMVNELANSPKDRNACDLLVWADLDFDLEKLRSEVEINWIQQKYPDEEYLVSQILNPDHSIAEKMVWAWVAAGTKKHNGRGFKDQAVTPSLILNISNASEEMKHPLIIQYIIKTGDSRQYEGMPMAFPLIWEQAAEDVYAMLSKGKMDVKDDPFVTLPDIGLYPSCAFDIHTGEGKKAISDFVFNTPAIKALFDGVPDPRGAVGTTIFRVEGHQVNKRLQYPGGPDMVDIVDPIHMMGDGVKRNNVMAVYETVSANMERLHWYRRKALGEPVLQGELPASKSVGSLTMEVASSPVKKHKGLGLIQPTPSTGEYPVIKLPSDANTVTFSVLLHGEQVFLTLENKAHYHDPNWVKEALHTGELPYNVVEISPNFWDLHLSALATKLIKHAGLHDPKGLLASAAVDDFHYVVGNLELLHTEFASRLTVILCDEIQFIPIKNPYTIMYDAAGLYSLSGYGTSPSHKSQLKTVGDLVLYAINHPPILDHPANASKELLAMVADRVITLIDALPDDSVPQYFKDFNHYIGQIEHQFDNDTEKVTALKAELVYALSNGDEALYKEFINLTQKTPTDYSSIPTYMLDCPAQFGDFYIPAGVHIHDVWLENKVDDATDFTSHIIFKGYTTKSAVVGHTTKKAILVLTHASFYVEDMPGSISLLEGTLVAPSFWNLFLKYLTEGKHIIKVDVPNFISLWNGPDHYNKLDYTLPDTTKGQGALKGIGLNKPAPVVPLTQTIYSDPTDYEGNPAQKMHEIEHGLGMDPEFVLIKNAPAKTWQIAWDKAEDSKDTQIVWGSASPDFKEASTVDIIEDTLKPGSAHYYWLKTKEAAYAAKENFTYVKNDGEHSLVLKGAMYTKDGAIEKFGEAVFEEYFEVVKYNTPSPNTLSADALDYVTHYEVTEAFSFNVDKHLNHFTAASGELFTKELIAVIKPISETSSKLIPHYGVAKYDAKPIWSTPDGGKTVIKTDPKNGISTYPASSLPNLTYQVKGSKWGPAITSDAITGDHSPGLLQTYYLVKKPFSWASKSSNAEIIQFHAGDLIPVEILNSLNSQDQKHLLPYLELVKGVPETLPQPKYWKVKQSFAGSAGKIYKVGDVIDEAETHYMGTWAWAYLEPYAGKPKQPFVTVSNAVQWDKTKKPTTKPTEKHWLVTNTFKVHGIPYNKGEVLTDSQVIQLASLDGTWIKKYLVACSWTGQPLTTAPQPKHSHYVFTKKLMLHEKYGDGFTNYGKGYVIGIVELMAIYDVSPKIWGEVWESITPYEDDKPLPNVTVTQAPIKPKKPELKSIPSYYTVAETFIDQNGNKHYVENMISTGIAESLPPHLKKYVKPH